MSDEIDLNLSVERAIHWARLIRPPQVNAEGAIGLQSALQDSRFFNILGDSQVTNAIALAGLESLSETIIELSGKNNLTSEEQEKLDEARELDALIAIHIQGNVNEPFNFFGPNFRSQLTGENGVVGGYISHLEEVYPDLPREAIEGLLAHEMMQIAAEGHADWGMPTNFNNFLDHVEARLEELPEDEDSLCFVEGTRIEMWPSDTAAISEGIGNSAHSEILAKTWYKPIENIAEGDLVVSFGEDGKLRPSKVTRLFRKDVKIVLDFFGTGVTPGHVYFRADNDKAHKFETLIDILRDDGVIETAEGVSIRAATGLPIDDPRDGFVQAVTGEILDDGAIAVRERGELRLGTRFITEDGRDYCIADLIEALGSKIDENGLICRDNGEAKPFHWDLSETLPKPEDYVLKRSGTSLEKIYQASEWEAQRPQMPPPMRRDGGPVGPLPASEISRVEPNTPLAASSERYARSRRPIFDARTDAGAKPVTSNKVN